MRWAATTHDLPMFGTCRDFEVTADIPEAAGLYAFTTGEGDVEVRYVGRTSHLWMVTLGRLPGGGARGGQRYGRPKHAGETRKRVNAALATEAPTGAVVQMWLLPCRAMSPTALADLEERYIARWDLRRTGLNRG